MTSCNIYCMRLGTIYINIFRQEKRYQINFNDFECIFLENATDLELFKFRKNVINEKICSDKYILTHDIIMTFNKCSEILPKITYLFREKINKNMKSFHYLGITNNILESDSFAKFVDVINDLIRPL